MFNVLDEEYYIKALYALNVSADYTLVAFCENTDIETVVKLMKSINYRDQRVLYVNGSKFDDWQQLLMMGLCEHNVIANSTFSWWGAYLNMNESKRVCFPAKWFTNGTNTADLCPPEWIRIV